jgi:GPI mannosyltransferase 3
MPPSEPSVVVAPVAVPSTALLGRRIFASAHFHALLSGAVAALHAVLVLGRIHPDELYQVLEPGLNRAFGFGVMAWEWQVGLRNWALPGIVSLILKAARGAAIEDPRWWRALIEIPQYALHVAMLLAVYRLAARRVSHPAALLSIWLVALYGPVTFFAGRTMGESISTAFLVWGLEQLDDKNASASAAALAGVLFGAAEIARYGSAVIIIAALLWLLSARRWKAFALTVTCGLVMAAALGALDNATWGDWFHSLKAYIDFNVTSGKAAAQFGTLPWFYYFLRFFLAPFAAIGLVRWFFRPEERAWNLVFCAVAYWLAIALTPHKEARFLYPTLVLLSVAAAPSFSALFVSVFAAPGQYRNKALLLLALAVNAAFFVFPGEFSPRRTEQFQLTAQAGRQATAFALVNEGLWGAGGHFYLGANIPWCTCDFPTDPCFQMATRCSKEDIARGAQCPAAFNRVVTTDGRAEAELEKAGFTLLERRGISALWGRD